MRNHGLLLSTATLSLCAMFSAQAVAQDTTADERGGLRDIVVTARKASESLQTTPVAVTAPDSQDRNRTRLNGTNATLVCRLLLEKQKLETTPKNVQPRTYSD